MYYRLIKQTTATAPPPRPPSPPRLPNVERVCSGTYDVINDQSLAYDYIEHKELKSQLQQSVPAFASDSYQPLDKNVAENAVAACPRQLDCQHVLDDSTAWLPAPQNQPTWWNDHAADGKHHQANQFAHSSSNQTEFLAPQPQMNLSDEDQYLVTYSSKNDNGCCQITKQSRAFNGTNHYGNPVDIHVDDNEYVSMSGTLKKSAWK